MRDTETARLLLCAALRDLRALENMLDTDAFPAEIFGFHAQQTVEKTLKAWLVQLEKEVPRTHNIRHLLLLLEEAGLDLDSTFWDFIELTAFAVQFRYEAYEELEDPFHRPELLDRLRQLTATVEKILATG